MVTLVLNSPHVDLKVLRHLASKSILVAVDGGLDWIVRAGLTADWALGDFDSVETKLSDLPPMTKLLRFRVEKDYTDLELALKLVRKWRPRLINILGLFGGSRVDHQLTNTIMLCQSASNGCLIKAWTDSGPMLFTNKTQMISIRDGSNFSVMALAKPAHVTIKGAKYPTKAWFMPGSGFGLGNKIKARLAVIAISSGSVCIRQWQDEVDWRNQ